MFTKTKNRILDDHGHFKKDFLKKSADSALDDIAAAIKPILDALDLPDTQAIQSLDHVQNLVFQAFKLAQTKGEYHPSDHLLAKLGQLKEKQKNELLLQVNKILQKHRTPIIANGEIDTEEDLDQVMLPDFGADGVMIWNWLSFNEDSIADSRQYLRGQRDSIPRYGHTSSIQGLITAMKIRYRNYVANQNARTVEHALLEVQPS